MSPDPLGAEQMVCRRIRAGLVSAFGEDPPPRLVISPDLFIIDAEVARRVAETFDGVVWTVVTVERLMRYGYDLGYCLYLPLEHRAYYMPGLVMLALASLDVAELVLWRSMWEDLAANPTDDRCTGRARASQPVRRPTARSVWSYWTSPQAHWVALSLEFLGVYGSVEHLGFVDEGWREEVRAIVSLADGRQLGLGT